MDIYSALVMLAEDHNFFHGKKKKSYFWVKNENMFCNIVETIEMKSPKYQFQTS